jgi:glycerol uptake facilitator-like aquaporin
VFVASAAGPFTTNKKVSGQLDTTANLVSELMGTAFLCRELYGQSVMFTTHPHLVPKLRMIGGIIILLIYAWIGTT